MTVHAQNISRVVVLSAVILLACLGLAQIVANFEHPLSGGLDDYRAKRYLRTTVDTEQVIEQDDFNTTEERTIGLPLCLKTAIQKLQKFIESLKQKLSQRTTDKLFKRYKVHKIEADKLLRSSQYRKWRNVVEGMYKNNYGLSAAAMVKTLTARYGDEVLRALLNDAMRGTDKELEFFANLLEIAQLRYWANSKKSADDVFQWLRLNDEEHNIFTNPSLDTWIGYVKKQGNEKPFALLLTNLAKRYDERQLANMLVRAEEDATSTVSLLRVKEARHAMLDAWVSGKKTVEEVFELLQLGLGEKLLQSPVLNLWISYVRRQKQVPERLLFAKLQHDYKDADADLAFAIISAKTNNPTKLISMDLEQELFKQWKMSGKSADDIYNLLGVGKKEDNNQKSMADETYYSYVSDYLKEDLVEYLRALDRMDS